MPDWRRARWRDVGYERECEVEVLCMTQVATPLMPDARAGWSVTFRLIGCREHRVAVPSIVLTAWLPLRDGHILERSVQVPYELFVIMKEGEGHA